MWLVLSPPGPLPVCLSTRTAPVAAEHRAGPWARPRWCPRHRCWSVLSLSHPSPAERGQPSRPDQNITAAGGSLEQPRCSPCPSQEPWNRPASRGDTWQPLGTGSGTQ